MSVTYPTLSRFTYLHLFVFDFGSFPVSSLSSSYSLSSSEQARRACRYYAYLWSFAVLCYLLLLSFNTHVSVSHLSFLEHHITYVT
ncbi:hypothetical protein BDW69DRAFT_45273 [Aspergillus filifer]